MKELFHQLIITIFIERNKMITTIYHNKELRLLGTALLGCGLITIGSLIRVPLYPVPFTCQTLAIFILALTQSPKEVLASVLCYLFCASLGLPVLDGRINSLWITGKCAGYLISFPIAAYLIARLRQTFHPILALLCGQTIILLLGWIGLTPFLGAKTAFFKGVLLFIPSGILKAWTAIVIVKKRSNQ